MGAILYINATDYNPIHVLGVLYKGDDEDALKCRTLTIHLHVVDRNTHFMKGKEDIGRLKCICLAHIARKSPLTKGARIDKPAHFAQNRHHHF